MITSLFFVIQNVGDVSESEQHGIQVVREKSFPDADD